MCVTCDGKPAKKTQPDTPFATTSNKVVKEMLKLADTGKDDVVYDLGSGDGRIVIAAARDFGARGVGVELDGGLVDESIKNAEKAGVSNKVKFLQEDFFTTDIKDATIVTLYLLPEVNKMLLPKLLKELKPGSRIVSHRWDLDRWEPDMTLKAYNETLYMWFVPADVEGDWDLTMNGRGEPKRYKLSIKQRFQNIKAFFDSGRQRNEFSQTSLYGNEISFYYSNASKGRVYVMTLEGIVRGNVMEGKAIVKEYKSPFATEYSWKAIRQ